MAPQKSGLNKRARSVRLMAMDVDGVLTGGEIVILQSGEEIKFWNAKDRLGLALLRKYKIPMRLAWISGRSSQAIRAAADDLGVHHLVENCFDKKKALNRILQSEGLPYSQVAFIGDDLIDLGVLKKVGFACCPGDAAPDVKKAVHYVSPLMGGRGVVRDVLELILKAQKKWDPLIKLLSS